jgi:hypothetical protein
MTEIMTLLSIDAVTGKETERELTAQEITERLLIQSEFEARQSEQQAKAVARESALAKLSELGLTAEEVAAL